MKHDHTTHNETTHNKTTYNETTHKVLWVLSPNQMQNGFLDIIQDTPTSDALKIVTCTRDTLAEHLAGTHILVDGYADAEALDTEGLAHVVVSWAGIPTKLRSLMHERPHLALYNSHYNAPFVAQHSIALLLAAGHRILPIDQKFRTGEKLKGIKHVHLAGKTVLLIGYGHIGKAIEPMLACFGAKVTRLRRHADAQSYGMAQRDHALAEADAIIMSLPHTSETNNFLDASAFSAMKDGVILVNVGRGKTINQDALYEALQSHDSNPPKVAAAGIDVWWDYPEGMPDATPFHTLDNVVITPHRADEGDGEDIARVRDVVATLESITQHTPRNHVNVAQGY